jgi:hypothetical protein
VVQHKFKRILILMFLALLVSSGLLATARAGQGQARPGMPAMQATAAPGTTAPIPTAATPATTGQGGAFLTMSPQAGFPLDPFVVSLQGGGPVAASTLAKDCPGYITSAPSFSVEYRGKGDLIRAFFYSDGDTTLVLQTPDRKFLCNDNTTAQLLDPTIELQKPAPGRYNLWVGSAVAQDLIPGFLVLTTAPNVRQGTFGLSGLVKRPTLPDILPVHAGASAAIQRLAQALSAAKAAAALQPGSPAVTATLTARGDLPAIELTAGITATHPISVCSGLVNALPDYAFKWTGAAKNLSVYFAGSGDTALAVRTPDGAFVCNDDTDGPRNQNPLVVISQPVNGSYLVWVGRVDPTRPVTGTLTVVPGSGVQPPALKKP